MKKINFDSPISQQSEDKLSRACFAKHISEILIDATLSNEQKSLVFGLYGKWGSGKTSLINMIKENIGSDIFYNNKLSDRLNNIKLIVNNIFNCIVKGALIYFAWKIDFQSLITYVLDITHLNFIGENNCPIWINIITIVLIRIFLSCYVILLPKFQINYLLTALKSLLLPFLNNKNDDKIVYANFLPWNIQNQVNANTVKNFFELLKKILKIETNLNDDILSKIIDNYVNKITGIFSSKSNDENVEELKNKIAEILKKQKRKIIIFIDDIDRLDKKEIKIIFNIVKSFANLPNILYFLSFDREIISNFLDEEYKCKDGHFIDKIIQVPFEMPTIKQEDVNKQFLSKLNEFVINYPDIEKDMQGKYKNYWNATGNIGFTQLFNDLRDVARFFNTLSILYNNKIHREVNFIDFLFLTIIQYFAPELYNFIRKNQKFFISELGVYSQSDVEEHYQKYEKEIINCLGENSNTDIILDILVQLFPDAPRIFKNHIAFYQKTHEESFRYGDICCKEHFSKYFSYDIKNDELSLTKITTIIQGAKDELFFQKTLLDLDKQYLCKEFLDKLENYAEIINDNVTIENIIKVLFDNGDYISLYDKGFLAFDIYSNINRIVYKLLKKKSKKEIANILIKTISNSKGLYPQISFVGSFLNKKEKIDNFLNSEAQILKINNIILDKIYEYMDNDIKKKRNTNKKSLIKHRRFLNILYYCKENGDNTYLDKYITEMTKTNSNLLQLLNNFITTVQVHSDKGYYEKKELRKKYIEDFLDIGMLKNKIDKIQNKILLKEYDETIQLFKKEIQNDEE